MKNNEIHQGNVFDFSRAESFTDLIANPAVATNGFYKFDIDYLYLITSIRCALSTDINAADRHLIIRHRNRSTSSGLILLDCRTNYAHVASAVKSYNLYLNGPENSIEVSGNVMSHLAIMYPREMDGIEIGIDNVQAGDALTNININGLRSLANLRISNG